MQHFLAHLIVLLLISANQISILYILCKLQPILGSFRTCITFISFSLLSYEGRISLFHPNNQVATDDAEGSVILHPFYLVRLESLGGEGREPEILESLEVGSRRSEVSETIDDRRRTTEDSKDQRSEFRVQQSEVMKSPEVRRRRSEVSEIQITDGGRQLSGIDRIASDKIQ